VWKFTAAIFFRYNKQQSRALYQLTMLIKFFPRIIVLLLHLMFFELCYPNDGAFRAAGNQLIPVYESDVTVKKEILTLKRTSDRKVAITVYYEFFNPKSDKKLEVGFEAVSPYGDVSTRPVNGRHPYITAFTVNMNEQSIPFTVSIVSDSLYYKNGKYKSKTVAEALKESEYSDDVNFFYVYHFRALFKQGINIIKHTYTVDLSSSVLENYDLEYILTAAKRWGNRQIDDFTLQIDMGEFQDLCMPNTFFSNISEWQLPEGGKSIVLKKNRKDKNETDSSEFFIRKGTLIFKATNFKPRSELYLHSFNTYYRNHAGDEDLVDDHFDWKRDDLPFSIEDQNAIPEPANELSKKILKNLPFARRGYIFKSPELQTFFERQTWYRKDEAYQPILNGLTSREQAWVSKW